MQYIIPVVAPILIALLLAHTFTAPPTAAFVVPTGKISFKNCVVSNYRTMQTYYCKSPKLSVYLAFLAP